MSKCLCSRCHTTQSYHEIKIPIKYTFNEKRTVFIEGIERLCDVCGFHVDDIETTRINCEIAKEAIEKGEAIAVVTEKADIQVESSAQELDDISLSA